MKLLPIFAYFIFLSNAFAQEKIVVSFVEKTASDWQILHSLDDEGLGIDPALADPDFNTTWMTLGMANSSYDGPAFTPNQTTPIRISGGSPGTGGTLLANPGADRNGTVYLIKEVNGPPMGTSSLDFDITHLRPYRLYLNGHPVIDNLGVSQPGSAWDLYWANQVRQPGNNPAILVPGKNILAISLHPFDQNDLSLNFDMALTGVAGSSDMVPLGDPAINDFTATIEWFTATTTSSLLRYGPSRSEMTNSLSLPDPTYLHRLSIPHTIPGQRLYYEILKPDASSFHPPAINSFTAPQPFAISGPILRGVDFPGLALTWTTPVPAHTLLRYGLDPDDLDQVSEDPAAKTSHQVTFPESLGGGLYTYELVATDLAGNSATATGTFAIHPQVMRGPFLQKATPTSMTVHWRTRSPGVTLIRYGQDPANLAQIASGTSTPIPFSIPNRPDLNGVLTDHSARIEGLQPATKYYYQIALENSPAPAEDLEQFFTTPPLHGTPAKTRIWVVGDSGKPGSGVQNVKDAYLQYSRNTQTDVWLMLGDNAYNSGTDSEYQVGMFDVFPELLKNTPVWPTMGNHDRYTDFYYGIFELPANGQSGGIPSGTEKYYSFDHGNIHFVCLNSEEDPPGMLDWLKNDLQSTRADWIIAFFHHGPYTKGSHDSDLESKHFRTRQDYLPILERYSVDLVLAGHSHQYERSHLIDGHYFRSPTYRAADHAINPGPGSPYGNTDTQSGFFNYTTEYGPYQKTIATPNDGHISATVGASSKLSAWRDTAGGDRFAITHPNPHPVHVSTIRALGSMVIDIDGQTLHASYLDSNGQIRDHFQINKVPETSPAITWWQERFGADTYPRIPDWLADPDNDTHNNLAEFAHGGEPFQGEQLIEATLTTDGLDHGEPIQWFTVQYKLREGAQVVAESSENLITFSPAGIETRRLGPPNAEGIAPWESRIRRTNQRSVFFQLKISR